MEMEEVKNRVKIPEAIKAGYFYRLYQDGKSILILVTSAPYYRNKLKRNSHLAFDYVDWAEMKKKVRFLLCQDIGVVSYDDLSYSKNYLVSCPALERASHAILVQFRK